MTFLLLKILNKRIYEAMLKLKAHCDESNCVKVGIVTILSLNLGNRLQNYALQQVLKSLGIEVETLRRREKLNLVRRVKGTIKKIIKSPCSRFYHFDKNIRWSKYLLASVRDKKSATKYYDFFIAGSDQIWNPMFPSTDEDSFLTFSPKEKNIAYAASFGISDLPEELLEKYEFYMNNFSEISVREGAGVEIVKQFEGCTAQLVLDPTLLLNKSDWEEIAIPPKTTCKYVLKYFLGDDLNECDNLIKQLLGDIDVLDIKDGHVLGKEVGPSEFLGLINNAELICTDSFHATIFSTIFRKPFVVFERSDHWGDMSSRMDTICNTLNLSEHRFSSPEFQINNVMNPHYNTTEEIIKNEQINSIGFLKSALKI